MTHRLCIDLKLTDLEVARVQIASASWLLQVRHRVAYDYVERSCSDCGLTLSSNDGYHSIRAVIPDATYKRSKQDMPVLPFR